MQHELVYYSEMLPTLVLLECRKPSVQSEHTACVASGWDPCLILS